MDKGLYGMNSKKCEDLALYIKQRLTVTSGENHGIMSGLLKGLMLEIRDKADSLDGQTYIIGCGCLFKVNYFSDGGYCISYCE